MVYVKSSMVAVSQNTVQDHTNYLFGTALQHIWQCAIYTPTPHTHKRFRDQIDKLAKFKQILTIICLFMTCTPFLPPFWHALRALNDPRKFNIFVKQDGKLTNSMSLESFSLIRVPILLLVVLYSSKCMHT